MPQEEGVTSDGETSSDDEYADLSFPPPPYPEDVLRTKSLILTRMTAAEALEQVLPWTATSRLSKCSAGPP